ncbi:MAG: ATP-binding cassette domain-containing protein [Buchnera aphidicola (Nurudea shiraii)]
MALIYVQNASFTFNHIALLNQINFKINKRDRICLIGNNGTGKSTFLNILTKEEPLDSGFVIYKNNVIVKYLKQNVIYNNTQSVYEFICEGIEQDSEHLKDYFNLLKHQNSKTSSYCLNILKKLENIFNKKNLWKKKEKVENIIKSLNLNEQDMISSLSRGCLKKAELGKILISDPDLMILDEPTNYLDIITINWLEEFLIKNLKSVLFVSHNRSFINKVSTKIINLNRGNLISWTGNYDSFLKEQYNNVCLSQIKQKKFNKKLKKEILWANSGVQARSTKNESRIKELKRMINEKNSNTTCRNTINILINQDNYKGDIFFKLREICFKKNDTNLIYNFSDTIKKGEKIALIGANGSGKSTLLKLILGQLHPDNGSIFSNSNVKIAYFDQTRVEINLENTVLENLSSIKEEILINSKKYHKLKYLESFLFPKEKIKLQAKKLSGGEINKLLLAKLFLKKSNVLILDEPTNDLDLESLKNLENALQKYTGVILFISHDETFVKNIANKYWNFEKNGYIQKYLNFHSMKILKNSKKYSKYNLILKKKNKTLQNKKKHSFLNYNLKKELKNILNKIEKTENDIAKLQNNVNSSNFFSYTLSVQKKEILNQLKILEKNLKKYLLRWEYLELQIDKTNN